MYRKSILFALLSLLVVGLLATPLMAQQRSSAVRHNEQGLTFLDEGQYDKALEEFNEACRHDPN